MLLQRALNDDLDRFISDVFRPSATNGAAPVFAPAVDIREEGDALVLEADLPGMRPEDLKVSIENGVLTIAGERKEAKEDKTPTFHRVERTWGAFERRFQLPRDVSEEIDAKYASGVLTVKLTKRPEARARQIDVKVG